MTNTLIHVEICAEEPDQDSPRPVQSSNQKCAPAKRRINGPILVVVASLAAYCFAGVFYFISLVEKLLIPLIA